MKIKPTLASLVASLVPHAAFADVTITFKKLNEAHVQGMYAAKNFKAAREIAIQCSDESDNPNCQLFAAEFMLNGVGGEQDDKSAFKYLTRSAEHGSPAAQALLGNFYHNGIGTDKDTRLAVKWWEESAKNCNTWAQNATARSYYDGELVPQDKVKALFWVSVAARYKFPNADKGVEVIQEELNDAQQNKSKKLLSDFLASTHCGKDMPIVNHEP